STTMLDQLCFEPPGRPLATCRGLPTVAPVGRRASNFGPGQGPVVVHLEVLHRVLRFRNSCGNANNIAAITQAGRCYVALFRIDREFYRYFRSSPVTGMMSRIVFRHYRTLRPDTGALRRRDMATDKPM